MSKQILLSGTYIAKHIKDANLAESKQFFTADMRLAMKKAAETEFWLMLLHEGHFIDDKAFDSINADCVELNKILTAIVKTSKETIENV